MLSDEQIKDLKTKYGDLCQFTDPDDESRFIVCRSATRAEYQRFQAQIADQKKRSEAAEVLLDTCTVYPDAAGRLALYEKRPALVTTFAADLLEFIGLKKASEKKVL